MITAALIIYIMMAVWLALAIWLIVAMTSYDKFKYNFVLLMILIASIVSGALIYYIFAS